MTVGNESNQEFRSTKESSIKESWAKDVQQYKASKQVLPWKVENQHPITYITRYQKSREEREYDPITTQYRDIQREKKLIDEALKSQIASLNKAKEKQLKYTQNFNLINHTQLHFDSKSTEEQKVKKPDTRVGYNIISNLGFSNHHYLPPNERPTETLSSCGKSTKPSLKHSNPHDFNIISNRYVENHESRFSDDSLAAKKESIKKFWKTRDYNPVVAKFYDKTKEEKFLEDRELKNKEHGKDSLSALPHSIKHSEGLVYNIVTQKITHQQRFNKLNNTGNRSLNKKKSTEIEKRIQVEREEHRTKAREKALNRFAHERHSQSIKHGYDPVTNQTFYGRNSKVIVPVRTKPKLGVWEKLALCENKRKHIKKHPTKILIEQRNFDSKKNKITRPQTSSSVPGPAKITTPERNPTASSFTSPLRLNIQSDGHGDQAITTPTTSNISTHKCICSPISSASVRTGGF